MTALTPPPEPPTDPDDIWSHHAELLGLLAAEETFAETLLRVAQVACVAIPGCTAGSVTLWREGHPYTVVSTDELARSVDDAQYEVLEGPCIDASRTGEPYEITDMTAERRWPTFTAVAAKRGALSSLSLPLSVRGEPLGALNLYSDRTDGFRGAREVGAQFAAQASIAIANAQVVQATRALADELAATLRARAVVDQATGVLMARHDCDPAAAAALLAEEARRAGGDERTAAQRVVDSATGGPAS